MSSRKVTLSRGLLGLLIVGLISCVTINIYFPAEEVKKAAEQIVGEIRPEKAPAEQPEDSSMHQSFPQSFRIAVKLGATAYAQKETTVSNANIRNIKNRLKSRQPQLIPFFNKGIIGEGNKGYIEIVNPQALSMKDRANVQRLVEADRGDRRQLYSEVARALNVSGQEARIAGIFAQEWQKASREGWFIQKPDGQWVRN